MRSVFEQFKLAKENELRNAQAEARQLQAVLGSHSQPNVKNLAAQPKPTPQSPSPVVIPLTPSPAANNQSPVIPQKQTLSVVTPPQASALPGQVPIPIHGNDFLRMIAKGIQDNRSNDSFAKYWYAQEMTNAAHLPPTLVNQVYGKFYWIMKNAGKLCGDIELASGHSRDLNWGEKVFTSGKVNGAEPAVEIGLLNHYRVQAIVEVLNETIRNG